MAKCKSEAILMIHEQTKNNIKYIERKIKDAINMGSYNINDPNDIFYIVNNLEYLCFKIGDSKEWIQQCNMINTYPLSEKNLIDRGLYLAPETLYLQKIESSADFWYLMDELIDDQSKLYYNRDSLLNSFTFGDLYGLKMHETEEMRMKRMRGDSVRDDSIFCKDYKRNASFYLVVCFCVCDKKKDGTISYIWTHTRARHKGLATILVNYLEPNIISEPLDEAVEFWDKMGFTYGTNQKYMIRK